MKKLLIALALIGACAQAAPPGDGGGAAGSIRVTPNGSQASIRGPSTNFSGAVRIDPVLLSPEPGSRITAASVTFEPGSRSAWPRTRPASC